MITRFMDVDMGMLAGEIASVPSKVGDQERPPIGPLSGVLSIPSTEKSSLGVDRESSPTSEDASTDSWLM